MKIADANVILAYAVDFDARREDGQIVRVRRHNREAAVAAVDGAAESGALAIPDRVAPRFARTRHGPSSRRQGRRTPRTTQGRKS